jgi:hypothetical protein
VAFDTFSSPARMPLRKIADSCIVFGLGMTVPAAEIKHLQPTTTMVGGRVVYQR